MRPLNASQFILTQIKIGTVDDQRQFDFGLDHIFERGAIDYGAAFSQSHSVLDTGEHGDCAGGGSFERAQCRLDSAS